MVNIGVSCCMCCTPDACAGAARWRPLWPWLLQDPRLHQGYTRQCSGGKGLVFGSLAFLGWGSDALKGTSLHSAWNPRARTCLLARVPQIHPSHPAVPSSKVLIGCGGSRCKQRHLNLALGTSTCSWTEPSTLMRSSWIFSDQLHHRGLWYCKVSSWDPSFRHACQKRVVATISLQEFKRAEHMPQIGQNAWRISCYFRQPKRYTPNPRDPRVIMIYPASPSKLPFSGEPHFSRESPFGQPGKLLRFGSTSMTSLVVWQLGLPLPLGCQTFCRVNYNDLKTTPPWMISTGRDYPEIRFFQVGELILSDPDSDTMCMSLIFLHFWNFFEP